MSNKDKLSLLGVVRPLLYSLSIFFVLFLLITQQYRFSKEVYLLFSFIGGVLIFEESIFTVFYTNKTSNNSLSYITHGINHTVYPQIFYIGLVIYSYLLNDYFLGFGLALLSLGVYFLYFYYLPKHLSSGHSDNVTSNHHQVKIEFLLYFLKFLSYFVFYLALFELLRQSYISGISFALTSILVNFLYLYTHLSRKHEVNFINLFVASLFSILTTVFILKLRVPATDYSASISTLVFYLTSGIFYHKIDGNFNYKIFIEYASIALILSVFLFSI